MTYKERLQEMLDTVGEWWDKGFDSAPAVYVENMMAIAALYNELYTTFRSNIIYEPTHQIPTSVKYEKQHKASDSEDCGLSFKHFGKKIKRYWEED